MVITKSKNNNNIDGQNAHKSSGNKEVDANLFSASTWFTSHSSGFLNKDNT